MRKLVIAVAAIELLALAACGSLDGDPEINAAHDWYRAFKAEQPELARSLGEQCAGKIGSSALSRDGALVLFQCVRAKAEAQGAA